MRLSTFSSLLAATLIATSGVLAYYDEEQTGALTARDLLDDELLQERYFDDIDDYEVRDLLDDIEESEARDLIDDIEGYEARGYEEEDFLEARISGRRRGGGRKSGLGRILGKIGTHALLPAVANGAQIASSNIAQRLSTPGGAGGGGQGGYNQGFNQGAPIQYPREYYDDESELAARVSPVPGRTSGNPSVRNRCGPTCQAKIGSQSPSAKPPSGKRPLIETSGGLKGLGYGTIPGGKRPQTPRPRIDNAPGGPKGLGRHTIPGGSEFSPGGNGRSPSTIPRGKPVGRGLGRSPGGGLSARELEDEILEARGGQPGPKPRRRKGKKARAKARAKAKAAAAAAGGGNPGAQAPTTDPNVQAPDVPQVMGAGPDTVPQTRDLDELEEILERFWEEVSDVEARGVLSALKSVGRGLVKIGRKSRKATGLASGLAEVAAQAPPPTNNNMPAH